MKNPFSLLVQQVYTQLGAISKNIKISTAALLPSYKKHLAEEEELIMMGRHDTGCIMYDFRVKNICSNRKVILRSSCMLVETRVATEALKSLSHPQACKRRQLQPCPIPFENTLFYSH